MSCCYVLPSEVYFDTERVAPTLEQCQHAVCFPSFHFALCLSRVGLLVGGVQLVLLLTGVCRRLIFKVIIGNGGFNLPIVLFSICPMCSLFPFPLFSAFFWTEYWVNYVFISFWFLCWSISQTVFILGAIDLQHSSVTHQSAFKQYCTTSHTGKQHIPIPSRPAFLLLLPYFLITTYVINPTRTVIIFA